VTDEQFKIFIEVMEGKAAAAPGGRRPRVERAAEGEPQTDLINEIESETKAYEKQTEVIEKLEKQYSSLSQGITKKYKLEEAKAIRDHSSALIQLARDLKNATISQDDYNIAVENAGKKMKEATAAAAGQAGMSDALAKVGQSALGLGLKSGGLTNKMVDLGNQLNAGAAKGGSMKTAMMDMGKSMGKQGILKAFDLLAAGFKAFAKLTTDFILGQDKAISSFRKATGAGKEYNLQIAAISVASRKAGLTAADQGKAFTELYSSMSSFTELNKGEQNNLVETTNLLGKMGVAAGDQSKILDQMTRTLGKSAAGAAHTLRDLAGSAIDIGVAPGKMVKDFAASFGELSKFGDSAIDVFKDLAVQSKKTGIEVSRLMAITKKFDTFEGAATAVGKLNAILGGPYLNSIDMLNASEGERIEQIRTTLQLSGQQFEALNRFEKMAIADALGMSVEETGRLMKMSTAEMQMQALEAAELAEKAADMQTMMEKITSALSTLALDMRPVIEGTIMPMIDGFASFIEGWGQAQAGASAFANTMTYVSTILAGMLIPIAALIAVMAPGVGWPIALALLGVAGLSLGGGAMAGSFVESTMEGIAETTASGKASRDARKAKGMSDGGISLESVHAADYFASEAYGPSVRVNMNEFGKEGAILPDGTYVATATDMKDSIAASKLVARELAGLRSDIQKAAGRPVHLMVEDGREFASHIVNNAGMTPFLVG